MDTVLIIFFLSVQSSYANNTEVPATEEVFDTVQFYASGERAWRIKTYATDEDVHAWSLATRPKDIIDLARANTEKHYGDVLNEGYIIQTDAGLDGMRQELTKRGLSDSLERSEAGFLFWAPEGTHYRTKSHPRTEP